jgi:chromosomal replication initiation ATPase DnaA
MKRGRGIFLGDERVLGSSDFVSDLAQEESSRGGKKAQTAKQLKVNEMAEALCRRFHVPHDSLAGGESARKVVQAREEICYLWVKHFNQNGSDICWLTGMKPPLVYQAARRGEEQRNEWESCLNEIINSTK